MNFDFKISTRIDLLRLVAGVAAFSVGAMAIIPASQAQADKTGKSFVENFDKLDKKRWYVSDGWSNGDHQNCTWSRSRRVSGGKLRLGFVQQKFKDRELCLRRDPDQPALRLRRLRSASQGGCRIWVEQRHFSPISGRSTSSLTTRSTSRCSARIRRKCNSTSSSTARASAMRNSWMYPAAPTGIQRLRLRLGEGSYPLVHQRRTRRMRRPTRPSSRAMLRKSTSASGAQTH